jgi:hypothetical protein
MNTNIPGIRGIGSKLYKTTGYEGVQPTTTTPIPADQQNKYFQITGVSDFSKPDTEQTSANQPIVNNQTQLDIAKKIEDTIESGQNSGLSRDEQAYQDFLIRHQGPQYKAYGGPIEYTEYAYGGDISVPELYRAQVGVQVPLDPNENNMSLSNLTNYFTEKKEGDPGTLPQSMQPKTYTVDPNQVNPGVSQKFKNKSEWNVDLPALGDATIVAGNIFENIADSVRTNRQQQQLLENATAAETNYGINNQLDKGTYDPNSGLFRPDQMGFNGVVKYGGGVYATGGSTEDEDEAVQYMTQEEIDDFIANGGELEYL